MAINIAPGSRESAAIAGNLNLNEKRALIHLDERDGLARDAEAVRIGVPLPAGWISDPAEVIVTDAQGVPVPYQAAPLALWGDRSVRWLLVDALARASPEARTSLSLRLRAGMPNAEQRQVPTLRVVSNEDAIEIDTGPLRVVLEKGRGLISTVHLGGVDALQQPGTRIRVLDAAGSSQDILVERLIIEEQGPLRACVVAEGGFRGGVLPLRFRARAVFIAGSAAVRIELVVRNPRAARHPGGLWDLGDSGSCLIKDLTLCVYPAVSVHALRWYAESPEQERENASEPWSIYQDSSGGEQWQSPNHIDARSQLTVRFRGYRVTSGTDTVVQEGHRAAPVIAAIGPQTWVAAAIQGFWQNFPKSLRWHDGVLEIGLFPGETRGGFELQGGEQKRHTVLLEFGTLPNSPTLAQLQRPLHVSVDPAWVELSGAVTWLSAQSREDDATHAAYVGQIIEGAHSFYAKREIIDEYGWRNFGDLYADHEAVHHRGAQPFISHYNNQYDFVYGAFVHFMRSGDGRWRELMEDAARHHIDIDIYHTQADKPAFNGGLFWHTDHYKPAGKCTHRTYGRGNADSWGYGGGPSNEHNYTSGLLHYFYLTGDQEAAASVRELAEWVLAMDDGARTVFGLIDAGATGGASKTLEPSYHHPGRGAGNSINALLDAYALTRERPYLAKAEEILQRCIHPADDIDALGLDDPEHRWSYLVFLQILGKYLVRKQEIGETDYAFHYARASLLHYGAWVADNEVPFKDVLHKVELPTETWAAHDIRKCHVQHLAAAYATGAQRERFSERATFFFERCLADLMSFPTALFTRPLVILCVYGSVHDYFRKQSNPAGDFGLHNHDFGAPARFQPQLARLKPTLILRVRIVSREISRVLSDKLNVLCARLRPKE